MTLGCLRQRVDFDALLARRPLLRSAHFAVHHVTNTDRAATAGSAGGLSTDQEQKLSSSVDNFGVAAHRLGCMIPKRHVRRAVTRNLIRRQIRQGVQQRLDGLATGDWLVRVTQPWSMATWPSASSEALRQAIRTELGALLDRLAPSSTPGRPAK